MNKRSVPFLGLAAILTQVNLLGACASAGDPQNGGGSGTSSTGSAGSTSSAGTGGSSSSGASGDSSSGGSSATAGSQGTSGSTGAGGAASPDPSCMSNATAKEGAMCTQDCTVACGYHGVGTKTCTCGGGIFTQCHCPRPAAYMGAPTAGYCMTADGTTTLLNKQVCDMEWDQCIGKDVVSGVTPQGCACMKDSTGALTWVCGSTNQWFKLAM
jgi:hypothetical protein